MRATCWGIATPIGDCGLKKDGYVPPLVDDSERTRSLCRKPTRLNRFIAEERRKLITWGCALADATMRRHVLEKGAKPAGCRFRTELSNT